MAKNIIRLTESDLHRIVKESVERILRESVNEVELGGESLHGDNAEDWATVSHLRDANVARDEDLSDHNRYYQGLANPRYSALNNRRQGVKDVMNMRDTIKGSEGPDAFGKADDAGREKAKSIINNRNREKMNKQFGGW